MTKSAKELLRIDEKRVIEEIEKYIRGLIDRYKANGVLIGLSGGIDSALLTTLAVRALGKERVKVYYLYERDSEKESEDKARFIAKWLGLELNVRSIDSDMHKMQIYKPPFMRVNLLPSFLASLIVRFLVSSYSVMFGETPFVLTLRHGEARGNRFKKWLYDSMIKNVANAFDACDIHRREVLEKVAKEENLIILGGGNRSEKVVGWFTKGGIDDMPFSPISGLYKMQVKQLAEYLEIPLDIQKKQSSPDMFRGVTDEIALGISYDKIDIISFCVKRGIKEENIIKYGVTKKEIRMVNKMNRLSAWKREGSHVSPLPFADEGMDKLMEVIKEELG